jgi:hypothetical protein
MIRWKPWTVEVVGRESGNRFQLRFVRFWSQREADLWCITMNSANRIADGEPYESGLTFYRSVRVDDPDSAE